MRFSTPTVVTQNGRTFVLVQINLAEPGVTQRDAFAAKEALREFAKSRGLELGQLHQHQFDIDPLERIVRFFAEVEMVDSSPGFAANGSPTAEWPA